MWHVCCWEEACLSYGQFKPSINPILPQDMTEGKLRSLLENTVTEHNHRCFHNPEFTVTSGMEEEASLLMSCAVSLNVRFLERSSAWIPFSITWAETTSPLTLGGLCWCFSTNFLGNGFSFDQLEWNEKPKDTTYLNCWTRASFKDLSHVVP